MCCCATCGVLWGSRERLCKDCLTCFPFLMEEQGGVIVLMGRMGLFIAGI